jgi:cation transporter-like permease
MVSVRYIETIYQVDTNAQRGGVAQRAGRRRLTVFSIVIGSLSGVAAAAGTYFLGLEGENDLNDLFLVAGIGLVVAVMVATVTYRIAREDEPEA